MPIPEHIIEQIRNATDIVEIISSYLPLKKQGREFSVCCPFHNEKTPSFTVVPHKQIFYCFGCHKGGDVFKFLCEYENISYPEAIKRLAERAGIEIPFESSHENINRSLKESLLYIHELFASYWHEQLLHSAEAQIARDTLQQRGVSTESIQNFRIGYSPLKWEDTPDYAQQKKLNLEQLITSGLAIHNKSSINTLSTSTYGRFRGRLMFPISDDQGRIIAFSARALYPEDKMGKYINSPETPIFHKGKILFGLDKAKREIIKKQLAIICEGQLDLIACHAAGLKNTVAPQGTALTEFHAHILKRLTPEVLLCFDGDTPGQNAAIKAFDILLKEEIAIRVTLLPSGHDPDSFIKANGVKAFQELITNGKEFFDFYLNKLCSTYDLKSDIGRKQLVQQMGEYLQKAQQPLLTETYAQKTAQVLGISSQTILEEFKRTSYSIHSHTRTASHNTSLVSPVSLQTTFPSERELWLLRLFLMNENESSWEQIAQVFQPEWIENETIRNIFIRSLDMYLAGDWDIHSLLKLFPDKLSQQIICEAVSQNNETIPEPTLQLKELIISFRRHYCDKLMHELNQKLSASDISVYEQIQILQQKARIREIKTSPLF